MSRVAKSRSNKSTANFDFEAKLWLADDKLRNNMGAAETVKRGVKRSGSHQLIFTVAHD